MNESLLGLIGRAFRTFFDIVLFRRGPEDVPASQSLLIITIGSSVLLSLALGAVMPMPATNQVAVAAVETVLVIAWYWALLRFAGKPERFLQTTTAIFGYQMVLLPAFVLVLWTIPPDAKPEQMPPWAVIVLVVLGVWTLAVGSRILRSATQWPTIICVGAVLLQALVSRIVLLGLFPDIASGGTGPALPLQ